MMMINISLLQKHSEIESDYTFQVDLWVKDIPSATIMLNGNSTRDIKKLKATYNRHKTGLGYSGMNGDIDKGVVSAIKYVP